MSGAVPRALGEPLRGALLEVATRLDAAGIVWLLAGSAGRALQGWSRPPADLDLEVAGADAPRAAAALELEPGGGGSPRAIGTLLGAEVDLSAEIAVDGPEGRLAPDFGAQLRFAGHGVVGGRAIALAPPEEALLRALVGGRWSRVEAMARAAPPGHAPRAAYLGLRLSSMARAAR